MDHLKKALQKAGIFGSEQLQDKPKERRRKEVPLDAERKGHEIRNQCELCEAFAPNVEYYEHTNRSVGVQWLCIKCADRNNIGDDLRTTAQSPDCRSGMFMRGYGHTRKTLAEKGPPKKIIRVGR